MGDERVTAVMITEGDFERAIMQNVIVNLNDPHFEGNPDAAITFVMGGVAFAAEVKNILFGKGENHE